MARCGRLTRAVVWFVCATTERRRSSRRRSRRTLPRRIAKATRYLTGTLPNGLAFAANGDILISNFGTDRLEVMERTGESRVLADSIDGEAIGKVNFVLRDSKGRIWITVSTRIKNWMHALRTDLADGYIARYVDGKFRIVADGFHFTNEIRMDANEEYMYVVETTGGCISRLRVHEDGTLGEREVFGPRSLGKGAWPDGIAFDSVGNLWGTCVYSDKLFALTPQGDLRVLLDEGDPVDGGSAGAAVPCRSRNGGRPVRDRAGRRSVDGQRDLRRARICRRPTSARLRGQRIPYFRAPVPGLPMVHWNEPTEAMKRCVRSGRASC